MVWTQFMDMHSGGGTKEKPFEYIYIEAPKDEARIIFYNRFGHNPERVTCTCCGNDYSINESDTLEHASGYERGCLWHDKEYIEQKDPRGYKEYMPIDDYIKMADVLVISSDAIKPEEKIGSVPEQGYVWQD